MTELMVNPNVESAKGGEEEVKVTPSSESWSFVPKHLPRRVPLFISRDQTYYWSREWQEGEAEADEELRRGEARVFDDPKEALRWLDDPDD